MDRQRRVWRVMTRGYVRAGVAVACLAATLLPAATVPDLVPMPKVYQPEGELIEVSGLPLLIDASNRQCQIAAEEIGLRIRELGGTPGVIEDAGDGTRAGLHILPVTHPAAAHWIRSRRLSVTAADPGPQGYVIQMAGDRLAIIGSDAVGALYGAMTLRQMLTVADGKVRIPGARVYDKPDYRYRSILSWKQVLTAWAAKESDDMAAYKNGLDWAMRFKINLFDDYKNLTPTILGKDPVKKQAVQEMNRYAVERGIYPILWDSTRLGVGKYDRERPEFKDWDCVYRANDDGLYYCWSRDDLAREMIDRVLAFCRECHFRILFVHPVDGGGPVDPESWSERCERCRQQFGDERWRASASQFNRWAAAIRKQMPELIFSSCIYPYNAEYADFGFINAYYPGIREDVWRKNTLDYWTRLNAVLDPMIIPMSWQARPENMAVYRACFPGRPLCLYAHSFKPLGYFGTWHRLTRSNYDGNPGDMFYLAAGLLGTWSVWLNAICSGEYAWNTDAPGGEVFSGMYYDAERDHREPRVIMDEWVPRACRAFFGPDVGNRMAPVYQAGVLPRYIQNPGEGISLANKVRSKPLADVDPDRESPDRQDTRVLAPPVVDSAARMAAQVQAVDRALAAAKDAYAHAGALDGYRRKMIVYFYRRLPLLRTMARARLAGYQAQDLVKEGRQEQAGACLEAGLRQFDEDWRDAEAVLKATEGEKDLQSFGPLDPKNGDFRPHPDEVRKLLVAQLASLKVVLKPRPAGATVRVALYKGAGAEGTRQYLAGFTNVEAVIIQDLSLATLEGFDCLFVFQSLSANRDEYFTNLERFVNEGGRGVVFQHDMCGFGRYPFGRETPFPAICPYAAGRADARTVKIAAAHPVLPGLKAGDRLEHMYYDHILPTPGPDGTVVVTDDGGRPVVVVGKHGAGKVVFDGNINLSVKDEETVLTGLNAILCRGAIEWFTGVTLKP